MNDGRIMPFDVNMKGAFAGQGMYRDDAVRNLSGPLRPDNRPQPVRIIALLLWITHCAKRFEAATGPDYKAFLIAGIVCSTGFGLGPGLMFRR